MRDLDCLEVWRADELIDRGTAPANVRRVPFDRRHDGPRMIVGPPQARRGEVTPRRLQGARRSDRPEEQGVVVQHAERRDPPAVAVLLPLVPEPPPDLPARRPRGCI